MVRFAGSGPRKLSGCRNTESILDWRGGFPPTTVDDHQVQVVQGPAPGGTRVKLFFDTKSGLLIRAARFADTALGLNPSQVDYSDYRDLAGIEVPFHWTLTWTDGRSDFDKTEIQRNAPMGAAKFVLKAPLARAALRAEAWGP